MKPPQRTEAERIAGGYPHIRRVGAYLFFGWLSICSAIVTRVLLARVGLSAGSTLLGDIVNYAVIVVTFLALRDMTSRRALLSQDQTDER